MREPAILRLKTQPLQPLQEKGWRGLFSKSSLHSKPCQLLLNIGSVRIFTRFSTSKIATKNSKLNTENCKSASVREKMGRFLSKIEVLKNAEKWQNRAI